MLNTKGRERRPTYYNSMAENIKYRYCTLMDFE